MDFLYTYLNLFQEASKTICARDSLNIKKQPRRTPSMCFYIKKVYTTKNVLCFLAKVFVYTNTTFVPLILTVLRFRHIM